MSWSPLWHTYSLSPYIPKARVQLDTKQLAFSGPGLIQCYQNIMLAQYFEIANNSQPDCLRACLVTPQACPCKGRTHLGWTNTGNFKCRFTHTSSLLHAYFQAYVHEALCHEKRKSQLRQTNSFLRSCEPHAGGAASLEKTPLGMSPTRTNPGLT